MGTAKFNNLMVKIGKNWIWTKPTKAG